ncbi:MAG: hypothetical protein ABI670_12820 [Chloroflexota bacterium]
MATISVQPEGRTRYFSETGYEVKGRFLDYWKEGSLTQFGFPISTAFMQSSDADGKSYLVQYFERALFEYHPENAAPFDVLLAHLGSLRYRQLYGRNSPPNQAPNRASGSVAFPDTGKRLGGVFLAYWSSHGGLVQNGFPISDEFVEISPLDGNEYKVQYFERAVFELHPSNEPAFRVQLSLLGSHYHEQRYPTASAAQSKLITRSLAGEPTAGGAYLFWTDVRNTSMAIYGYNVNTSQEFLVKTLPRGAASLATDGRALAWIQGEPSGGDSIHTYNIATTQETTVIPSGTAEYSGIAVDNGTLYYESQTSGLVARNLSTGVEQVISTKGVQPVAADGKVLWLEQEQICYDVALCSTLQHLYLAELDNLQSVTNLATSGPSGFGAYQVSGNRVVWATGTTGFTIYQIREGSKGAFQTGGFSFPIIRGDMLVWTEGPGASKGWSIKGHDIATGSSWITLSESNSFARAWRIVEGTHRGLEYSIDSTLYLYPLFR